MIGWQVCRELAGVERIYAMRKKAVGLLGNAKGAAKPFRLLRIPAYRRNTWRIISLNFARCSTATA
ncbi:hypothetical protein ACNKHM_25850 [Shigella sonnei]